MAKQVIADSQGQLGKHIMNDSMQTASEMGFEEIKHGEAFLEERKQQMMQECQIQKFEDVATDSVYPLFTTDPKLRKEYTLKINGKDPNKKITDSQLNSVFDNKNKSNNVLQSICIQDDYMSK